MDTASSEKEALTPEVLVRVQPDVTTSQPGHAPGFKTLILSGIVNADVAFAHGAILPGRLTRCVESEASQIACVLKRSAVARRRSAMLPKWYSETPKGAFRTSLCGVRLDPTEMKWNPSQVLRFPELGKLQIS
jgi:hypothetical protein